MGWIDIEQGTPAKTKVSIKHLRKLERERAKRCKYPVRQTHQAYIFSNHWKIFKQKYFKRHPKQCARCKTTELIQLHHMTYERLHKERDGDVVPLCNDCHAVYHANYGTQTDMIATTMRFIHTPLSTDDCRHSPPQ